MPRNKHRAPSRLDEARGGARGSWIWSFPCREIGFRVARHPTIWFRLGREDIAPRPGRVAKERRRNHLLGPATGIQRKGS